jgi:peptidyl-prolyl cis-trans isomerase A (cyclophilin A)
MLFRTKVFGLLVTSLVGWLQTPLVLGEQETERAALASRAPDLYRVKFATTAGDFMVEVHRDWAPLGADRVYNLVSNKFFNNEAFFRVVPNFIVQFGLSGDLAVNHVWENTRIADDPVTQHNARGTLVFAAAGPNSRTTQLFINLRDNASSLDAQGFAPIGTVTEGMESVDKIYSGYGQQPNQGGITDQGDLYLNKNFPNLTRITSASIILTEAAPPAPKTESSSPDAGPPHPNLPLTSPIYAIEGEPFEDAYFDWDSIALRKDAVEALTKDADSIKKVLAKNPQAVFIVEGSADDGASSEWKLGQAYRMASASKSYLVKLGVPADRLQETSLGKERPQCTEATAVCWQKNRRAHIVLKH